jgi:hypothetical protein
MWTTAFWKAAAERAFKSAAQAVILFWAVADEMFNLLDINLSETLGIAAGGFVLSILSSVASGTITSTPGPSLTDAERTG